MVMKKALFTVICLLLLLCGSVLAEGQNMPRIEITTVSQSRHVMDFVTQPVAGHVSAQIATWTPDYVFPPEPYYEACRVTVFDENGEVKLSDAAADVKVRGNWTTTYAKKPLRIKFSEGQTMLCMNDGAKLKNWILMAEYKDGSMLRNKAALAISRDIMGAEGLYASDARLVEVEINGEYMGVYLLAEQQQVNPDRVNITEPEKEYTGTDIGYFLEFDTYAYTEDELHRFTVPYANRAPLTPYDGKGGSGIKMAPTTLDMTIKSDIYAQAQRDFIADYVANVYRIMYHAAYRNEAYIFSDGYTRIKRTEGITPREAVERVVNVDSLAAIYIISEVTCDADIYLTSFFMTADFGPEGDRRLTFTAPWDFDSSMGNKDRCADGIGFYAANVVFDVNNEFTSVNPWLTVLVYQDWFQALVKEKWTAAYDAGVFENTLAMIKQDAAQYAEAFDRNYDKWDNLVHNEEFGHELSEKAFHCQTHEEAAAHLYDWLKIRVDFLNDQWHLD